MVGELLERGFHRKDAEEAQIAQRKFSALSLRLSAPAAVKINIHYIQLGNHLVLISFC